MGKPINWEDDWIRDNYLNYSSYKAMAEDYSKIFTLCKPGSLKAHARKLGIRKPRTNYEAYTDEQNEWLMNYYPSHGVTDTVNAFNKKFDCNKTRNAIKCWAAMHDITVNYNVMLKNKLAGVHGGSSKRALKNPGETRMESGRLVMKTKDGKWDQVGRVVYEEAYGKIPKRYCVMHLNGDQLDYRLENLICVPVKILGIVTSLDLISETPELTRLAIEWAKLHAEFRKMYSKRKCRELGI